MQAEIRAKYALGGKFPHKCKGCGKLFYTYRPDAQTCSGRCRKAYSRSPAGALERLKRLGRAHEEYKADREHAKLRALWKAWHPKVVSVDVDVHPEETERISKFHKRTQKRLEISED
jgi:hypothetical protein